MNNLAPMKNCPVEDARYSTSIYFPNRLCTFNFLNFFTFSINIHKYANYIICIWDYCTIG